MNTLSPSWIHLAGNPPNIKSQTPPYWRYRVEGDVAEHLIDSWVITGMAEGGNTNQGIELKASFLLWYGIFGALRIVERKAKKVAEIVLSPLSETLPFEQSRIVESYSRVTIKMFGAPDLVSQGSSVHWRCKVGDTVFELTDWRLVGKVNATNHYPREDIENPNPLQRLWLTFLGDIAIDDKGRAVITV